MPRPASFAFLQVVLFLPVFALSGAPRITLVPSNSPPLQFAAREIASASAASNATKITSVQIEVLGNGPAQSYRIERQADGIRVVGADATGAMYGGLDVAEAIRLGTLATLPAGERKPHIQQRGLKFNIPLDLRTPSYSDCSDAFQANIPEMWSREFWSGFLDGMARNRFNVLSLWNLHPFPSLVKVPEFPNVALADVLRTRVPFEDGYSHSGTGMFRPEHLKDVEVLRRMTIDEKIAFWREVIQMAKDRGVDVYWFTWNIFTYGADGKYGITDSQTNSATIAYFRASVRELLLTYPQLAGIGITAGEHMENLKGEFSKERWLWNTYGEGVRDALKQQPGRSFRLIHRFHQSGLSEILTEFKDYPGPFDFSYKYAVAHMYASTRPRFIEPLLAQFPRTHRTWLTVRNDDIYSFRWADPAFAREFIKSMPEPDVLAGFYMGPDGYCWGREAMSLNPQSPRELVMQKQWLSFMLWGRLSYDPGLPDSVFERHLAVRFPEVSSQKLLGAWTAASRIFPEITRFFWGDIDLRWLPEACLSSPRHKGFYTIRHFVEGECMPGEMNITVRRWRAAIQNKTLGTNVVTPPQVARNLRAHAAEALPLLPELRPSGPAQRELEETLGDIESFAHLGNYYAEKVDAACALALYDATSERTHQEQAIQHLENALNHWKRYAASYARQYRQPLLYNRVGWVDIPRLAEKVANDIEIARQWKTGSIAPEPAQRPKASIFGH